MFGVLMMNNYIDILIKFWKDAGVSLMPVQACEKIAQLPIELRAIYTKCGGMTQYELDSNLFRLWSVDELVVSPVGGGLYIQFSDVGIGCQIYALELRSRKIYINATSDDFVEGYSSMSSFLASLVEEMKNP